MPKRKAAATSIAASEDVVPPSKRPSGPARRSSARTAARNTNPNLNSQVFDAPNALRASPDSAQIDDEPASAQSKPDNTKGVKKGGENDKKRGRKPKAVEMDKEEKPRQLPTKNEDVGDEAFAMDPEADGEEEVGEEELKAAVSRPPPVNSDYLPLPWKGRLGYACLNTYLRQANPPVFSSRTCRIASILDHRHPLKDPTQPEHATKNRPDKEQPAEIGRGQKFVEELGVANARDIIKMIRWNEKYGIKFLRLSSEMFPFASHEVYGYKLAPFAAETLGAAGKVIAELGHRVSTHPGQFTQLGSPRESVIKSAIRDLEYHDELLSLLKLPPQQDRDAVMILHMGGTFGNKAETLDRFRKNYAGLSPSIKNRLVLENDDVCWSVHDLLPVCQELNIPMVLDFHHHNIYFDAAKLREGTKDIMELYPAIRETWTRKGITQKMHYSEPTPAAVTPMQRRKHNPRPATLPPCANDMDLMIEAKDKEQAVFELMRNFRLPGWNLFNDIIPHVRADENKPMRAPKKAAPKKSKKQTNAAEAAEGEEAREAVEAEPAPAPVIPEEEVGMGGPDRRVYWPPGMEEWLRPAKRIIKKKEATDETAPAPSESPAVAKKPVARKGKKGKAAAPVPTPSTSDADDADTMPMPVDAEDVGNVKSKRAAAKGPTRRKSGRAGKSSVSYKEEED
ncbi:UV damage endonuclease uvsE [Phyllosticta citribraziliensis]|uniref:UV damage endonuclease uvsE n=1 Tax=Phyllosticta citribraziliensis TaxID=989973 RepID=A0ABR1MBI2_9PEZI